ncbi:MAG: tripartite tricarboxylate transporter permease [Clostridium sp.]
MFGLMFTLVGVAPIDGTPRFTFGSHNLMAGFDTLPTLIGIFAIADILVTAESMKGGRVETIPIKKVKGFGFSWQEFVYHLPNFFRSALIGAVYRYSAGYWRFYLRYAVLCNCKEHVQASGGV